MKIYILKIIKDSNETKVVTLDEDYVFEKILDYLEDNDKRIYLEIWENKNIIGYHDVKYVVNHGDMAAIPKGHIVELIMKNRIRQNFTGNM